MTSSAARFSDALPLVVDASGGIDNARQAVLSLAVAGRLVPQLSREGRGHDVIAEIRLQRDGQDIQGRSLNRKRDETASDDQAADPSFEIPGNWCWARLGEIAVKLGAGSTPLGGKSVYKRSGIKFLRSQNVWDSGLRLDDVAFIDAETHQRMEGTHVHPGDLLLNITGASIGRCAVVPDDFDEGNVSQHVAIVRLVDRDLRAFVHLCLISPYFQALIMGVQVGVSREGLSMKRLQDLQVPIPPVMEQKRIVAKVDQLMALCDDLEAKQTKKRDLATQSTRSALTALAAAERGAELSLAWQRVASSFQTLVSTPDDVRSLRGAVAELATRGLLTAQSEKERPAAQLTAKLDAARVGDTDTLPLLPSNWLWARLADLLAFGPKNGYSPKAVEYPTDVKALTLSATTSGRFAPQYFKYIDEKIPKDSDLWLRDGDVLIQRGNTLDYVGIAAVYRGRDAEFIYPDLMIKIRAADFVDVDFLHLALNARPTRDYFKAHASGTSGTMPKINQSVLLETPIPVPPLAEQKRIVIEADRLMSLLDDLEAKLRKQEKTATRLAESLAAAVAT